MPEYQYRGRDSQGALVNGSVEAASESAAADALLRRAIIPLEVQKAKSGQQIKWSDLLARKVSLDELHIFSRQMFSLTKSGIPILRAIKGLSETAHSKRMQQALEAIHEQLTAGKPLSTAMNHHPDVFSNLFVAMVHVGENTGRLDDVFLQLSGYIEREQETRRQIKSAIRYPIFVLLAIVIAMVVLNMMVIPKFADMFSKFGAELPWATKLLISTSDFFLDYWPFMLLGVIGVILGLRYYVRTEKGRYQWDKKKLGIPAVGSIIERSTLSRFGRSFAMMLRAGVPMTQGLSLVADAVDNAYMHDRIVQMRRQIEGGDSLLKSAHQSELFTPLVLQMVAVGEETGNIDSLLDDAAEFYERETDFDLQNLTAKIEPMLIGFVAVIVLILALGIYLPMWDMLQAVKGG
ncbi:type II secretion system F family protein [Paraferrimonas sedimenticola]|uniref:MSHA biogenesis protein MshG n=1 Tax=Paraferrimonas sedimenticola TaxID=375674 RepID=A0AA37RYA4_9GAMM|nr:type II secretion system F family protein [Paraferrimonas sedimenticola]GLP97388.1 MSHA biogenesis protein MshG [Paraferrimonas sedimenticola]